MPVFNRFAYGAWAGSEAREGKDSHIDSKHAPSHTTPVEKSVTTQPNFISPLFSTKYKKSEIVSLSPPCYL